MRRGVPCRRGQEQQHQGQVVAAVYEATVNGDSTTRRSSDACVCPKLSVVRALAAAARLPRRAPAQTEAQVGARLRNLRALPHRVGVGGGGDQEAHQRQVRHRGVPGVDAGQGNRHQPGPDARHRRHDHHRPVVRRAQLPAARHRYYPFIFRDADHLLAYSKSPVFKEMVEEFRKKTGIQIPAYTYYGARGRRRRNRPFTDSPA